MQGRTGESDARAAVAQAAQELHEKNKRSGAFVRSPLVLLIGDDEDACCAPYLESLGLRVIEPAGGADPVDIARSLDLDIIVINFDAAPTEGRVVLRRLKADPRTRTIPIVGVSPENLAAHPARDCTAIVNKPLATDALLVAIEAVLSERARAK